MQGSHGSYPAHYDEKDKVITTAKEFTDYDRTIHHTDRLLDELIKIITAYDENTILYYFSDHGEIVNVGHGFVYDEKILDQYQIPLITFQHKNTLDIKQLIDKYRGKDNRLNNLNSSYIISEILGFHVDSSLVEQAQKNGEYVYHADSVVYKFDDIVKKKVLQKNNLEE